MEPTPKPKQRLIIALIVLIAAIIFGGFGYYLSQRQPVVTTQTSPLSQASSKPRTSPDTQASSTPANVTGSVDTAIKIFLDSYKFTNPEATLTLLDYPKENLRLFKSRYGVAQDCPSGCFHSGGIGIAHGSKVGWVSFDTYGDTPKVGYQSKLYDPNSQDEFLYSETFLSDFKAKALAIYEQDYLPLLIKDSDTSDSTLLRIAQKENVEVLLPDLLENTKVRNNKEILTIIVKLPETRDPSFETSETFSKQIEEAKQLLESIK